jgi:hypothetical protein
VYYVHVRTKPAFLPDIVSVLCVGSRLLNFYWFSLMVKIVLRGGHKKHIDEFNIKKHDESVKKQDKRN